MSRIGHSKTGTLHHEFGRMILLFTTSYPYGRGEQFINAELMQLAQFHSVCVFPETIVDGGVRDLPNGVLLSKPAAGRPRFVFALKALRFMNLASCIVDVLRSLNPRGWRFQPKSFEAAATAFRLHLKAAIVRKRIVSSGMDDRSPIYYAFWGDSSALALALHRPHDFSVRFHGYDLYDHRYRFGQPATQRRIVEKAANVLAVSEHGRTYLRERYPEQSEKIQLARLGVPVQSSLNPDPVAQFTIASISNAVPIKRLHLIPKALKILVDSGEDVFWIHVGDGPDLPLLRELSRDLGLVDFVEFTGGISHAEDGLYPFLRERPISWVLNVSESEGLPVSLMEALSFGIPVIATDVGGSSELVIPSSGLLLPSNPSPEEIAQLLVAAIQQEAPERAALRLKAANTQRAMFNCHDASQILCQHLG